MSLSMQDIRTNVAARVKPLDGTIIPDILDPAETHDNLICALDIITAPVSKGAGDGSKSYGHVLTVSALHRDHHDDGDLGPHGHNPHGAPGWAVDVACVDGADVGDNHETRQLIRDLCEDKDVTKIGTLASVATRSDLQAWAAQHDTLLFVDEGTGPHVHFQSAEYVGK